LKNMEVVEQFRQIQQVQNFITLRSAFPDLLYLDGRTDKKKKTKYSLRSFLSQSHLNSHTENTYCCRLLLTERHSDCHVPRVTVQHIYRTNTVLTVQSTAELYLQ
jgi:hypothetical protein